MAAAPLFRKLMPVVNLSFIFSLAGDRAWRIIS